MISRPTVPLVALLAAALALTACPQPDTTDTPDSGQPPITNHPSVDSGVPDAGGADGGYDAGDAGEDGGADAGMFADITGTSLVRYITESGVTEEPFDFSGIEISALVFDGGSVTTFPGTGTSDGKISIPGVPAGEWVLQIGADQTVVTSERALDLGYSTPGRSKLKYPTSYSTTLNLQVQDLAAWQPDDELELSSLDAAVHQVYLSYYTYQSPAVATGATTLSLPVAYAYLGAPLIDGSLGDVARLHQRRRTTLGSGTDAATVIAAAVLDPFKVIDGQTVTATGEFSAVPQDQLLEFQWDRGAFSATGADLGATFSGEYQFAQLFAHPHIEGENWYGGPILLVNLSGGTPTGVEAVTVPFGDAAPPGWERMLLVGTSFERSYQLGAATPLKVSSFAYVYLDAAQIDATTVVSPLLGFLRNVKVDGNDALASQSGSGSPTITWDSPSSAIEGSVTVTAYLLTTSNGATRYTYAWSTQTTGSQITLPPFALPKGTYFFNVAATTKLSEENPDQAPFRRQGVPLGYSSLLTGTYTVE